MIYVYKGDLDIAIQSCPVGIMGAVVSNKIRYEIYALLSAPEYMRGKDPDHDGRDSLVKLLYGVEFAARIEPYEL